MFRVLVTALVLLLTAAPDAALLCRVWCEGHLQSEMCRHNSDGGLTVLASHSCDGGLVANAAVVNEGSKRSAAGRTACVADMTADYLAPVIIGTIISSPSRPSAALPHTPGITVLRI